MKRPGPWFYHLDGKHALDNHRKWLPTIAATQQQQQAPMSAHHHHSVKMAISQQPGKRSNPPNTKTMSAHTLWGRMTTARTTTMTTTTRLQQANVETHPMQQHPGPPWPQHRPCHYHVTHEGELLFTAHSKMVDSFLMKGMGDHFSVAMLPMVMRQIDDKWLFIDIHQLRYTLSKLDIHVGSFCHIQTM